MSKKDLAPQPESQAPTVYEGPTGLADNITSKDLRLPRIALLQSKSPQVENQEDKYKAGMFIDTLTQEILAKPVVFTPAFIFKNVIKWKPRSEGGGMLYKTLNFTDDVLRDLQWNGQTKPVADLYINAVVMVNNFEIPLIISFCKTSLKAGQDLATLAQLSGCAWKYTYELHSEKVSGASGTYYVMRIKRGALATPEQAVEARDLYNQVKDMAIDTDYEGSTHDDSVASTEEPEF